MLQSLAPVTVPCDDECLAFFRDVLGFTVLEDAPLGQSKRWVVVPSRGAGAAFWADYETLRARGVSLLETPRGESYGLVAVFVDPWGGKWDLPQPADGAAEIR
jgi:catechol 2,3-dioxygenase-like lactoylglutathione lyase family enzyme